ncbi:unnamed protein product [Urochloa decumbens]|uniref:Uncharacterized protein n=1 Tax=Urochloa decumbens TaxID=240449 RepID=A0ABC9GEG0_9POAL
MDMDEQTSRRKRQWGRTLSIVPSPENGPKRFAFRIRRRRFSFRGSPSLLVSDRLGVWSVGHGRYIRKTRRHRYFELRLDIDPLHKIYKELVRKHGMHGWPEFRPVAGEVAALRQRLFDMFWDVRPEENNVAIVQLYRERRRRARAARRAKLDALVAVVMAVLAFVLVRVLLLGRYGGWANFCMCSAYLAAVYLLDTVWHAIDPSQGCSSPD